MPDAVTALEETRHKEDFWVRDSMAYDGTRFIYAGAVAGVLCRIDTQTGEVEKLANVIPAGDSLRSQSRRSPLRSWRRERTDPVGPPGSAYRPD